MTQYADEYDWLIGVTLSLIASFLSASGILVQKVSNACRQPWCGRLVWVGGLLMIVIGALGDLAAFGFAAQSLLAPLGGSTIVFNALLSPCCLRERLHWTDIAATLVILAGCTLAVCFGDQSEQLFTNAELWSAYGRIDVIVYFVGVVLVMGGAVLWIRRVEQPYRRYLEERHQRLRVESSGGTSPASKGTRRAVGILGCGCSRPQCQICALSSEALTFIMHPSCDPLCDPCRGGEKEPPWDTQPEQSEISPPAHWVEIPLEALDPLAQATHIVLDEEESDEALRTLLDFLGAKSRTVHAFLHAAVGGIVGAQSVLFGKTLAELLKSPGEALTSYQLYVVLACMCTTLVIQLRYLNIGLRYHDALLIVPIYQTFWVIVSIIAGGIYFQEFQSFSIGQGLVFSTGVFLALVGIYGIMHLRRTT